MSFTRVAYADTDPAYGDRAFGRMPGRSTPDQFSFFRITSRFRLRR